MDAETCNTRADTLNFRRQQRLWIFDLARNGVPPPSLLHLRAVTDDNALLAPAPCSGCQQRSHAPNLVSIQRGVDLYKTKKIDASCSSWAAEPKGLKNGTPKVALVHSLYLLLFRTCNKMCDYLSQNTLGTGYGRWNPVHWLRGSTMRKRATMRLWFRWKSECDSRKSAYLCRAQEYCNSVREILARRKYVRISQFDYPGHSYMYGACVL